MLTRNKNRLLNFLSKFHTPIWLFLLLTIVLIFRIPSFFEPYSYGDEMIYLTLGHAIRQGIPLYKGIHDNKPPLLYMVAAIAGNLFWFKAILAIWNLTTIFFFWKLVNTLFPKNLRLEKISTLIFALLTTIPLFEGNIVNAELFMIGPTILAFYLLLTKKLKPKNLIITGVLFSISTLFKVPAVFDTSAILFLWVISIKKLNKKEIFSFLRNTAYLALGFLLPIILTFVWYYIRGASTSQYLSAAYLQNIGYLSSWRHGDVQRSFLEKNSPLLIRALIVLVGFIILYLKKERLSKQFMFVSSWLILTLFAATLSERPYPHYLIQSIPPFSILFGMLLTLKNREQTFSLLPLTLFFLVPYYFNFWLYPVVPYYQRFISFALSGITKEEYFSGFGSHIPRNYKVADFITSSTKPNEKIFVWGDDSVIYALTKRLPPIKYVTDYHIKDFSSPEYVINTLNTTMPSFIVILPNSPNFPELDRFIKRNYGLIETIDEAKIWKLLGPNVRALMAR